MRCPGVFPSKNTAASTFRLAPPQSSDMSSPAPPRRAAAVPLACHSHAAHARLMCCSRAGPIQCRSCTARATHMLLLCTCHVPLPRRMGTASMRNNGKDARDGSPCHRMRRSRRLRVGDRGGRAPRWSTPGGRCPSAGAPLRKRRRANDQVIGCGAATAPCVPPPRWCGANGASGSGLHDEADRHPRNTTATSISALHANTRA